MLTELFACPRCAGPLEEAGEAAMVCPTCPVAVPVLGDTVLFTEAFAGPPDPEKLASITARYAPLDPEVLDGTPWWDAYAAFHPWNEAVRAAAPLLERLGSALRPGEAVLDLGDRSGWSGHSLAARFPQQRVVSVGLGGALGVRGHRAWLRPSPPGFVRVFLDLNVPLPFRDGCFSLLHGHDLLHDVDPSAFLAECARVAPGPWIFPHVHLDNRDTPHERGGVHRSGRFWREALSAYGRRGRVFSERKGVDAARARVRLDLDADDPDAPWPNALAISLPEGWVEGAARPAGEIWAFPSPLWRFDGVSVEPDPDGLGGGAAELLARHPPLAEALVPQVLEPGARRVLALLDQPRRVSALPEGLGTLEAAEILAIAPATPALARLQHFHATRRVLPLRETLGALWDQALARHAERPYLYWEDGSAFSYAETDQISRRLIPLLAETPGPLALVSSSRPEAAFLFWAAMRAGRLLHVLPASWSDSVLGAWLGRCGILRAFVEGNRDLGERALRLDDACLAERAGEGDADTPLPELDPETPAVVLPSSGTLGSPRGIVLDHRALVGSARNLQESYRWTPEDRVAATGELATMSGLRNRLLVPVLAGAAVLLGEGGEEAATVLSTTPAALAARGRLLGPRLRMVLSVGAPLLPTLKAEIEAHSGAAVHDVYGLTETAGAAILSLPDRPSVGLGYARRCAVQIRGEEGQELSDGEEGMLWLASANAARQLADGSPLPVWLDTGDRARRCPDGSIAVLGRRARTWTHPDGWKVALDELEAALLGLGASACCVCALGSALGVAVVGGRGLTDALRAVVADWAFPRRWLFLDALPVGPSGKVVEAVVAARIVGEGGWVE